MKLYKLTNKHNQTRGGMQWGEGVTHAASGEGAELCTDGVIHCYTSLLLAVLMDPVHANYLAQGGNLWLAEGDVTVSDGLKAGCKTLTTIHLIDIPVVTLEQRAAFGILSTKLICADPAWNVWAEKWLSGEDRSEEAAWEAAAAPAAAAAARAAAAAAEAAAVGKPIDFEAIAEAAKEYGAKQ